MKHQNMNEKKTGMKKNPSEIKNKKTKTKINDLSHCNGTRTHNQLVRKRTLNHLAKLASLA